jgi:hypothetical protein
MSAVLKYSLNGRVQRWLFVCSGLRRDYISGIVALHEESPCRSLTPDIAQIDIDQVSLFINCSVQVSPTPINFNVGRIDMSFGPRLALARFPLFDAQFSAKMLCPIMHRLVTQLNSSGSHQLHHHIIQAELETVVLVDRQHNHFGRVLDKV